jgi:hypothetical protein
MAPGQSSTLTECYPWITLPYSSNRGFSAGDTSDACVLRGYTHTDCSELDFIITLDTDLSFSHDYFECVFEVLCEATTELGGGGICHKEQGKVKMSLIPPITCTASNCRPQNKTILDLGITTQMQKRLISVDVRI